MAKEAKIGLLLGLMFIIGIAVVLRGLNQTVEPRLEDQLSINSDVVQSAGTEPADALNIPEAISHLERAVSLSEEPQALIHNNLGSAYLAFFESGVGDLPDLEKAVAAFEQASTLDSNHSENLTAAKERLQQEQRYAQANQEQDSKDKKKKKKK